MSIVRDPVTNRGQLVNKEGLAGVHARSASLAHWYSEVKGQTYGVFGISDTLTAAAQVILHITNTSVDKSMVITDIQMQTIGEAGTIPAAGMYWGLVLGASITGGTAKVPTNLNSNSGNKAEVTATHSTPTVAVAGEEAFRIYPKLDGEIIKESFQEGMVLGPNGSLCVLYTTTGSAGIAVCNAEFYMQPLLAG